MSDLFDIAGEPIVTPGPNKVFEELKQFVMQEDLCLSTIHTAKQAISRFDRPPIKTVVVTMDKEDVDNQILDLLAKKEEDIDTSDIPEVKDWSSAPVGKYYRGGSMGVSDVKHYDLMEVRPLLKTMNARLTRKRYADTSIRDYLAQIEPRELAEKYLEFYDAHPNYKVVCAGAKHHHWWKGGLEDHVREMIGMGLDLMDLYPGDMVFTKTDLIIACFLHDFNKIWIYRELTDEDRQKNPKYHAKQVFGYQTNGRADLMDGYSMILLELARHNVPVPTDIQWSAILFHEAAFSLGAWGFTGPTKTIDRVNTVNPLAVMVNMVDMYSSHFLGRSIA